MTDYRIEKDTLGEVKVPADKYWGAQTQRSKENFPIGIEKMPIEIIKAFAILKMCAACVNSDLGLLDAKKAEAIKFAAEEILADKLTDHFPLVVWQTGSGTQSNMNVNEVIAHVGSEWLQRQGESLILHPNDDVNKSQSSNDTYPTAMYIAFILKIENKLLPAITVLKDTFAKKAEAFKDIVKIGRTHLQDATPITLGQEISGWHRMLEKSASMIQASMPFLSELAIGGTAVGTGLNAHKEFSERVCKAVTDYTGHTFVSAENKFHALTSYDEAVFTHGAIKGLAADVLKIANDIRFLASGPRSGIGEIMIPTNEPGSSIMPGKVNPTQCEAITMVAAQVIGNDVTIGIGASQGNLELNVYKPLIAYNFLQSCNLMADGIESFNTRCAIGIEPNHEKINTYLNDSLMLVTALNPYIGYENAAKIAKKAYADQQTLKEAAVELGLLTAEQFDIYIDPKKMTQPNA